MVDIKGWKSPEESRAFTLREVRRKTSCTNESLRQ
eukprot:02914.XXX_82489_82593_1 [CDS] Oithona nana genome sequencing.